jgi:hypothetical protein
MRRYLGVLLVVCLVGGSGYGAPRENPRDRENPIKKFVKKVVRSLGDGLIIPTPTKP